MVLPISYIEAGVPIVCHPRPNDWVVSLASSRDGRLLATGGLFDQVYIWNAQSYRLITTLGPSEPGDYLAGVGQLVFHPSLPYLAYIEAQGTVSVVNTQTWEQVATFADDYDCAVELAFDNRLPRLFVGLQSCQVVVGDVLTNEQREMVVVTALPTSMSVSLDSALLSVVSDDGACAILTTESGEEVYRLVASDGKIEEGLLSPSVPLLLTASSTGYLSGWDTHDFQLRIHRPTDLANIWRCAVSSRTTLFAARASDGTILVWDYMSDNINSIIHTPENKVTPICFTSDGQHLLIGGKDLTVRSVFLQPSCPKTSPPRK